MTGKVSDSFAVCTTRVRNLSVSSIIMTTEILLRVTFDGFGGRLRIIGGRS